MNLVGLEIEVARVMLLNDGVVALCTISDDIFETVMEQDVTEITPILEPTSNGLFLLIGCFSIRLDQAVFDHLSKTRNLWVYLSGLVHYVMYPWGEFSIEPSELWAAKGVSGFMASQATA